jgi:hypothetical protein
VQVIGSEADDFARTTVPGVATCLGPLCVLIVQTALGTPGVSIATTCVVPLVIVAHPNSAVLSNKVIQPERIRSIPLPPVK